MSYLCHNCIVGCHSWSGCMMIVVLWLCHNFIELALGRDGPLVVSWSRHGCIMTGFGYTLPWLMSLLCRGSVVVVSRLCLWLILVTPCFYCVYLCHTVWCRGHIMFRVVTCFVYCHDCMITALLWLYHDCMITYCCLSDHGCVFLILRV